MTKKTHSSLKNKEMKKESNWMIKKQSIQPIVKK